SCHLLSDGILVLIFRDHACESLVKLASTSTDEGRTWTAPALTNVPDARTKQSAGNLPDGTAYLVGHPTGRRARFPLTVLLSADGETFDAGYTLRPTSDLQSRRPTGVHTGTVDCYAL